MGKVRKFFWATSQLFLTSTTSDKNFSKIFPEIFAGHFQKIFENFNKNFSCQEISVNFTKLLKGSLWWNRHEFWKNDILMWMYSVQIMLFCVYNYIWNSVFYDEMPFIKALPAKKNFAFSNVVLIVLVNPGKVTCFFGAGFSEKRFFRKKTCTFSRFC